MHKDVKYINVGKRCYYTNINRLYADYVYKRVMKVIFDIDTDTVLYMVYESINVDYTTIEYEIYRGIFDESKYTRRTNIICFDKNMYDRIMLVNDSVLVIYVNKFNFDDINNGLDISNLMVRYNGMKRVSRNINKQLVG